MRHRAESRTGNVLQHGTDKWQITPIHSWKQVVLNMVAALEMKHLKDSARLETDRRTENVRFLQLMANYDGGPTHKTTRVRIGQQPGKKESTDVLPSVPPRSTIATNNHKCRPTCDGAFANYRQRIPLSSFVRIHRTVLACSELATIK